MKIRGNMGRKKTTKTKKKVVLDVQPVTYQATD